MDHAKNKQKKQNSYHSVEKKSSNVKNVRMWNRRIFLSFYIWI